MPAPRPEARYDDPSTLGLVRRGYDPDQVDRYVSILRAALEQAQLAAAVAEQHARSNEAELRSARDQLNASQAVAQEDGFGFRVEKILGLARAQASAMRAQNLADAEAHRTMVERQLATWEQAIEDHRARLKRQHAAALTVLRTERADTEEQARLLLEQVRSDCERLRAEATAVIRQQHADAEEQFAAHRREIESDIAVLRLIQQELGADLKRIEARLGELAERRHTNEGQT